MFPFVAITEYVEPSLVVSHLSVDSFQRIATFALVPRSTSMPAFCEGVPASLLFKTMMLSSIVNVSLLTVTVAPDTRRFPATVTSLKVTFAFVATF